MGGGILDSVLNYKTLAKILQNVQLGVSLSQGFPTIFKLSILSMC